MAAIFAAFAVAIVAAFTFGVGAANADDSSSNSWKFLQTLDFKWVVPASSDDKQEDKNGELNITPPDNNGVTATLQVDFALQGNGEINSRELQIKIPKNVFKLREGKTDDIKVDIPFVDSGAYTADYNSDPDYIILTNNNRITGEAGRQTFTVAYTTSRASNIIDQEASDPVHVELVYNNDIDASSNSLTTLVDTKSEIVKTTKTFTHVYKDWQDAWGTKPAPADLPTNPWFVVFRVTAEVSEHANQPYTITFTDTPEDRGTFIGYTTAAQGYPAAFVQSEELKELNTDATLSNTTKTIEVPEYANGENMVNFFVVVAYPIDETKDTDEFKNDAKATVTPKDEKDDPTTAEDSAIFPYKKISLTDTPGELYFMRKQGITNKAGGVNRIVANKGVDDLAYLMNVGALNFTKTTDASGKVTKVNYGDQFTVELVDDAVYMADTTDAGDGKPKLLTSDDYEFQYVEPHFQMYTWEADYTAGKYKEVSYQDYANYPIITAFGKTSESDEWVELAQLKYENITDANGTYRGWRLRAIEGTVADGVTADVISSSSNLRLIFDKNTKYTGIRLSATVNEGKTNKDDEGIISAYYSGAFYETLTDGTGYNSNLDTRVAIRLKNSNFVHTVVEKAYNEAQAQSTNEDQVRTKIDIDNFNTLVVKDKDDKVEGFKREGGYVDQSDLYGGLLADHDNKAGYDSPMAHRVGTDSILDYLYRSETKKTAKVKNDKENKQAVITYELTATEYFDADEDDVVKDLITEGEYKPHNKGYFYDLLPRGMTLDTESVKAIGSYDYTYSLNNVNVRVADIQQYPNYQESGRTLVVFTVETEDNSDNYSTNAQIYGNTWSARSRLGVQFNGLYSWDSIADYGNVLYNPMAFETDNDWVYQGRKNTPGTGEIEDDFVDLLSSLSTDGDKANADTENPAFLYSHATTNVRVTTEAATGLTKTVSGGGPYGTGRANDQDIIVPTAGDYNYRLRFSGESSQTGEIVIYDSLENLVPNPGNHDAEDVDTVSWRGIFQSVDVSQPREKEIDVKVYYTTKQGLLIDETVDQDALDDSDANVDNSDIWTLLTGDESDEVKAQITGLAFDMRNKIDGEKFFLEQGESLAVNVYMKAPSDPDTVKGLVEAAEKTKASAAKVPYAYNGVSMRNILIAGDAAPTKNAMITHDYTRVGLTTASAVLDISKKVAFPEDYSEEEAAAFEGQTYTVTIKDKDGNPYTGGYSLRDAQSGYYYTETEGLYVRVDSDSDKYYVAGRDYEDDKEKVKYADETGNIYDESRGLDADGNPKPRVYSKRIKVGPSAYTFEGHEDGVYDIKVGTTLVLQEVAGGVYWIVAETPGDYTTTYVYDAGDSVNGGTTEEIVLDNNVIKNLTFTNTPLEPTPVGKLSISKTVKTAREGGENDIFTFTVSLADADGNPVEGAFPVSSPNAEQADATAEEATAEEANTDATAAEGATDNTDAAEATQEMLTFTEGQATVKLADGQTITISDLPADTFYTVEEEQPEGYEAPTATGDAGTIVADETQVAAFENNAKEEEPEPEPEPEEPAIEKYVNNDVHSETTYDGTIPYSILVSVPTDAESIEIRDRLDNQLVFADDEQTIAGTAVVKDENDHKAGGTVASAGTPITASATIDAKTKVLTVSVPDATSAQGKWIQVDFNAALDTTVVAVNDKLSVSKVTGNGEIDTAIEEHEGIPNNAEYRIAVGNSYEKYAPEGGDKDGWNPSNTVTTDIPTTSIAVDKTWVVGKSAVDWPTGATLTVQLTLDDAVATDSQGNAIECVLDEDNQEGTFTNLLALEQSTYGVAEVEVKDAPEGYTATVKETEGGFSITNTKEPEEPEEPEKPVIEKYVNNDVHQKLADITDTFTYDILAYVPADAAVVEITDTLDEQLTFADGADAQASAQAIAKTAVVKGSNNSTIGASGTSASTDGKSIEATAAIDGQTITITIPDATTAQGKWIQVTIQAKAQDNAQVADLEAASQAITNNGTVKGGSTNHTGVPNTASYRIGVLVEPEDDGTDPKDGEEPAEPTIDFGKYGPEDGSKDGWNDSNTVTIIVDEPTPEPEPEPEPETAQVTITKVDATTNNTLAGATLRVYTADSDTPLAEWQSTLDGYAINLVAPGNYVIEETKAPSGYSVNAKASFTIAEDGTLALGEGAANVVANGLNIVVADPPADYLTTAETTIYKTWYDDNTGFDAHQVAITFKAQYSFDEETWYDLPHKTVTVTGEQKGANGEWTASFDQLPAIIDGKKVKWRAVETDAPDGYLNATSTVAGANGMIAKNFVNDGSDGPKGGISISKKALGGTDELPGATLAILDADGNEVLRWVTTDRPHNFTLPAGASYTLRELEAPEGYALAEDIAFIITPEGDAAIQNGETVTVIDVLTMFDPKAPEPTPDPQPQPQPQPQPGQPTPNTPRTETKTTVTPTPAPTPVSPSTPTVARTTTAATADILGITASALLSLAAFAAGCVQLSRRRKQD